MIEKKTIVGKPTDDFIRIQDLWGMFVPRWHWFALSLFAALAVATFYLLSTPNIYTRTAAILVKDDSKSGSSTNAMSEFSDLGIFKSNTNINNELLTLKSPTLMTEVVQRLGLNESYTVRKGLRTIGLYKCNPIIVTYRHLDETPVSFTINLPSKKEFTISDVMIDGEELGTDFSGKMGDSIRMEIGTFVINPTKYWNDSFVGTSIRYNKGSVRAVTDYYATGLRADLGNEDATIINLSIDDASIQKAEDILNTLIEVYNEKWIQDKNQIIRLMNYGNVVSDEAVPVSQLEKITLFDNSGDLKLCVSASNLYYIESDDNYIVVWYTDSKGDLKRYMLRCRLKTVEESFRGSSLVRCHRKYIVNMDKVKVLRKEKDGYELDLDNDSIAPIPITKTYSENVLSRFNNSSGRRME